MAGILLLVLLVLLGAPLFAIIASSALIGFYNEGIDLSVIAIEIYRIVDTPVLLAIPLFTFAGYVLGKSKASQRLVRMTNALLGWMPGGLAVVSLIACAFFTALTGASGATIIALGAILYPAMKQAGYTERFNLGLITSSGSLGLLFPPSIALILYGVIAQQMDLDQPVAIDDLFLGGLLPGLVMVVLLVAWSMYKSTTAGIPVRAFDSKELINEGDGLVAELLIKVPSLKEFSPDMCPAMGKPEARRCFFERLVCRVPVGHRDAFESLEHLLRGLL